MGGSALSEDAYILYIPLKLNVLLIGSFHTEIPFDEIHAYMLDTGIPDARVDCGIIIPIYCLLTIFSSANKRSLVSASSLRVCLRASMRTGVILS